MGGVSSSPTSCQKPHRHSQLLTNAYDKADAIPQPYNATHVNELRSLLNTVYDLPETERAAFQQSRKLIWVVMVALSCWEYLKEPPFPEGTWAINSNGSGIRHVPLGNWGIVAPVNNPPVCQLSIAFFHFLKQSYHSVTSATSLL